MSHLGAETARVHILDRKYLRPLKTLHHSLEKHGTLQNCPVVIITNDPEVASDSFVRRIAERVVFLTDKDLEIFARIRGDKVNQRMKTKFAPRYTFLQLTMFRPLGFSRHVTMDCDMICLGPLDEALLAGPEDIKAVQEYGGKTFPYGEEPKPANFPARSYAYVENYSQPQVVSMKEAPPFNGGFVVLQGQGISEDLFHEAIRLSEEEPYEGAQVLTYETLRRAGVSYLRLPIWYNARRRMFQSLGSEFFAEHRQDVRLLHFTPGKPWILPEAEHQDWDRLWLAYENEGKEAALGS
jgi:lipopolysaccharide biosynthesis glycosyltransferase